jgi:hypothetical protein
MPGQAFPFETTSGGAASAIMKAFPVLPCRGASSAFWQSRVRLRRRLVRLDVWSCLVLSAGETERPVKITAVLEVCVVTRGEEQWATYP